MCREKTQGPVRAHTRPPTAVTSKADATDPRVGLFVWRITPEQTILDFSSSPAGVNVRFPFTPPSANTRTNSG
jgi:hypothetical protein